MSPGIESVLIGLAGIGLTAIAAGLAYRVGHRRARPRFPAALRRELASHKEACLGEAPARVERELTLFLGRSD